MNSIGRGAASLAFSLGLGLCLGGSAQAACEWTLFPTAKPEPSGNQLIGVSGTAANDVWEVGAAFHKARSDGYALHWDGNAWTSFRQSDPAQHGGQLSAVVALAKDDVLAVGQQYSAPNYAVRRAAAERWNGSRFVATPLPAVGASETFLYGIAAVAANDVWSVGGSLAAGGLQRAYVVHWDGGVWTQIAAPDVPNRATNLDAVSSTGPNDAWSVGGSQANTSSPFQTLAEHWDGAHWSIVPTPNVNGNSNVFNAVVALAPNDAWAIGDYYNGKAFSPLAEHWDGSAWRIVPTPDSGARTAFVLGATAKSPREVWAVGEIARGGGRVASYVLRWNGVRWAEVASQNVPHMPVTLLQGVSVIGGGSVWAVGGDANSTIVVDPVTEVRACTEESFGAHR